MTRLASAVPDRNPNCRPVGHKGRDNTERNHRAWPDRSTHHCRRLPKIGTIRVSVPPALPSVLRMHLAVVDFDIIIRIPAHSESRLVNRHWIVRRRERDAAFEVSSSVRDGGLLDLTCF